MQTFANTQKWFASLSDMEQNECHGDVEIPQSNKNLPFAPKSVYIHKSSLAVELFFVLLENSSLVGCPHLPTLTSHPCWEELQWSGSLPPQTCWPGFTLTSSWYPNPRGPSLWLLTDASHPAPLLHSWTAWSISSWRLAVSVLWFLFTLSKSWRCFWESKLSVKVKKKNSRC